jgi:hypothetical protein
MGQKLSAEKASERFHRPLVTIDNVLDTFKDGRKEYQDYCYAITSNMTPSEIAEKIGKSTTTIKNWLREKSSPKIFQTIDVLNFFNMLSLTYDNPRFPAVNLLASFLFWSGCIDGAYTGSFQIKDEDIRASVEYVITHQLGIDLKPSYKNSPKHKNQTRLGENGSAYSRLMNCMGIPKSGNGNNGKRDRKTRSKLSIPKYIKEISLILPKLEDEEKERAQLIIDDFIRVLIYSRGNNPNNSSYTELELIANKSRQFAYGFARQVLNIFKRNYPMAWIDDEALRINSHKKRKNYHPRIVIKRENWECINEHYPHLLDIKESSLF